MVNNSYDSNCNQNLKTIIDFCCIQPAVCCVPYVDNVHKVPKVNGKRKCGKRLQDDTCAQLNTTDYSE